MIHIRNALICDGSGTKPFPGELLIEGDKILEVSSAPLHPADALTLDAEGRTAAPGFIDAHRHCDFAALSGDSFGDLELAQGITTAVCGNCGLAPVPAAPDGRKELYDFLEPCLGKAPEGCFFPSYPDYFSALERAPKKLNLGVLAASGAVTAACKGFGNVPFTEPLLRKAEDALSQAMEAGALGLSCGIMYTPECWTERESFVRMARAVGKRGGYLTSHIRGEGDSLAASVREVIEIGEKAELLVNISHFKVTGVHNWGHGLRQAIGEIEAARARGLDVTADCYPYPAGSTTALSLVPPSVLAASGGSLPAFLGTEQGAGLLEAELGRDFPGWDNMVSSIGWERIVLSSFARQEDSGLAGKNLLEAAELSSEPPARLLARLIAENRGKVGVILMSMAPEDVEAVLSLPYVSLISDALYGGGDMPHPRLYGSFPRLIRDYVVERGVMALETAVRKMTALPAKRLGLAGRGLLKPGFQADVLLFYPERLRDNATFAQPARLSTGIDLVLVNGVLRNTVPKNNVPQNNSPLSGRLAGIPSEFFPGRVLRKGN